MITQAAKEMIDYLNKQEKACKESATYNAIEYTETGDKKYHHAYNADVKLREVYRKLYSDMCKFAHAIEQEMIEIAKDNQNV